ncbi:capsule biosynthesis GfcC family protein [Glaciecola sp. SC05]|uniref:capsule biosynthesis GfcC family protein n=1 Tax=Glaciecola sp. SC05 TaxID=1987355 RepID=UPI0035281144
MFRAVSLFFLLMCCSLSNPSHANVQVEINGGVYVFEGNPRLAEVLAPLAQQQNWYWPSAQLFNLELSSVEKQRHELLQDLKDEATTDGVVNPNYQMLISEISNWRLADRIQIEIDFELARFSLAANPRFENGNYLLHLAQRPKYIYVFGAVQIPATLSSPDNQCLHSVIKDMVRLDIADPSYVYLILPTGKIEKVAVAYWNRGCVIAMPGSLVYVPIRESQWFNTAKIINQKVTALALNRVPSQ